MVKAKVKERTRAQEEALAPAMGKDQQAAIRMLGNELHRLNQAVITCVENGLSVELQRTARHHADGGFW
ncbi:MAG: hypothetical protein ACTSSQ_07420, partial [Alphaproteobacteria bacterium]